MDILKLKIFKNMKDSKVAQITEKLPENEILCKQILNVIGNNTTKVVIDKDIKNSYYVYLNDTIYISNSQNTQSDYSRLCLIAHECIHSMQNKKTQLFNFIFSNVEIVTFIVFIILLFVLHHNIFLILIYFMICVISILLRGYLETNAVINAPKLTTKYLESVKEKNNIESKDIKYVENVYNIQTKKLYLLFIFSLFIGKFIRCIIIYLLYSFV